VPEGDTLRRIADRLRPALAGKTLVRFEAPRLRGDRPRPGDTIDGVAAQGKHLLIDFGGGLTLRTHLRMTGSWDLYRTGQRWRKPPYVARAVVETDDGWCAVCFAAPVVETFRRGAGPPPALARLGPDLAEPDPDLGAVLARLAELAGPDDEIGAVRLDQRIAAGIGNVYKSEVLFMERVDPFAPVKSLDDDTLDRILTTAREQLQANARSDAPAGRSTTVDLKTGKKLAPSRLWVYDRAGRPCHRCGSPISSDSQGAELPRVTYWCGSVECQASDADKAAAANGGGKKRAGAKAKRAASS
jgi:endonuclease VIII